MPSLTLDEVNTYSKWKSNIFIETGTYMGDTIYNMVNNFDKLYTIELSHTFAYNATKRFENINNVKIIQGDSSVVLEDLAYISTEPTFFWLDGHWSSGDTARGNVDCPLIEEIKIINDKYKSKCIVAIDDVRLFGTKMNEDWSDITRDTIIRIVQNRLVSCEYFPSHLHLEDRMVLHLKSI